MLARAGRPERVESLSYEPDPGLRNASLSATSRANGYANDMCGQLPWLRRRVSMAFYRARKNQGDNRLFSRNGRDGASFPVKRGATRRRIGRACPDVDLLKMDIQGAEAAGTRRSSLRH